MNITSKERRKICYTKIFKSSWCLTSHQIAWTWSSQPSIITKIWFRLTCKNILKYFLFFFKIDLPGSAWCHTNFLAINRTQIQSLCWSVHWNQVNILRIISTCNLPTIPPSDTHSVPNVVFAVKFGLRVLHGNKNPVEQPDPSQEAGIHISFPVGTHLKLLINTCPVTFLTTRQRDGPNHPFLFKSALHCPKHSEPSSPTQNWSAEAYDTPSLSSNNTPA